LERGLEGIPPSPLPPLSAYGTVVFAFISQRKAGGCTEGHRENGFGFSV